MKMMKKMCMVATYCLIMFGILGAATIVQAEEQANPAEAAVYGTPVYPQMQPWMNAGPGMGFPMGFQGRGGPQGGGPSAMAGYGGGYGYGYGRGVGPGTPYGGMQGNNDYMIGPGAMMGQGMVQMGMGPGMIRNLGVLGYIPNEALQKFFDETKVLRKQLHDLMFDYAELLRQPKIDREKRVEIENKIQALRQKVYEKAPRYQFLPQ